MADRIEESFGDELRGLRILVEQTSGGVLAFSLYSDVHTRAQAAEWLAGRSAVPVSIIRISRERFDIRGIVKAFPVAPRRCLLFFDVEAGFPYLLGYLNLGREALLAYGHALVFWIREEGLRRIAEEAPDFWAWSSRVFDFRTAQTNEVGPSGPHDATIGHLELEKLEEQIAGLKEYGNTDLELQVALGRRLVALGRFAEAETALRQAVEIGERRWSRRGLPEALLLLGNSKLEQGFLEEAEPLYRRSLETATQARLAEQRLAALRQLSLLEQMRGNTGQAYQFALETVEAAERLRDPTSLAGAYDQFGNVLFLKKDLRGAEQAYLAAAKYEEQLRHNSDLAFTLAKLGQVYEEMGALSQAESALRRAAALFREYGPASEEQRALEALERIGAHNL